MNRNGSAGIVVVIAIIVIAVAAGFWYYKSNTNLLATGQNRTISFTGDAASYDEMVYPGEKGVKLGGFDVYAGTDVLHKSVSVTLQSFAVSLFNYWTGKPVQYLTDLQLYNPDTNQVLQTQPGWTGNSSTVTFSNLNIFVPSGSMVKLALMGDVSPTAQTRQGSVISIGDAIDFDIETSSIIVAEPNIQVEGGVFGNSIPIMTLEAYNAKIAEQKCVRAAKNPTDAESCYPSSGN